MGDHDVPEVMIASGKMLRLPDPQSSSYAHQMLALCLDNKIEKVYLLRDEEAKLLLEAEQLFNEYGISLVHEV